MLSLLSRFDSVQGPRPQKGAAHGRHGPSHLNYSLHNFPGLLGGLSPTWKIIHPIRLETLTITAPILTDVFLKAN